MAFQTYIVWAYIISFRNFVFIVEAAKAHATKPLTRQRKFLLSMTDIIDLTSYDVRSIISVIIIMIRLLLRYSLYSKADTVSYSKDVILEAYACHGHVG